MAGWHLDGNAGGVVGRHAAQRDAHARLGHRRDAVLRNVHAVALQRQARACKEGFSHAVTSLGFPEDCRVAATAARLRNASHIGFRFQLTTPSADTPDRVGKGKGKHRKRTWRLLILNCQISGDNNI